jgi:multiple sugar transport system ATP-binding protein
MERKVHISLSNVGKTFRGGVCALRDINLDVYDGEFLSFLGPSGSGKTTCLRLISGLDVPTEGTICFYGKDVSRYTPRERNISMVFQEFAIFPHMNVYDNIAFPLTVAKWENEKKRKFVMEAAELLSLDDKLKRYPAELSGGEKQRVALGRAMVKDPEIYLFDEPLANLDAKLKYKMASEFVSFHKRAKRSLIYVTHDQEEAMTMSDRIAIFNEGSIVQVGTPDEVFNKPRTRFVAEFVGSPDINLFPGTKDMSRSVIKFDQFEISLNDDLMRSLFDKLSGDQVLLGIRPYSLRIDPDGPIEAVVSIVMNRGYETQLSVDVGDQRIEVIVGPNERVTEGDRIRLGFDPERIHFFDPNTPEGLRIEMES